MKLWHDDVRPAPDGWLWARTNDTARQILETEDIDEISMDHDLGYDGPPPGPCEKCGGVGKDGEGWICGACDGDGFIGGEVLYIAGTAEDDGYALAQWMVQNRRVPPKITIHSWNPVGAENMRRCFEEAGHSCVVKPYDRHKMKLLDMIRSYNESR